MRRAMRHQRLLLVGALLVGAAGFDFEEDDDVAGGAPTFFGDEGGASAQVMHSLDGGAPTPRGSIQWRVPQPSGKAGARVSQAKVSGAELDALQAAARAGGYYTVSVPSVLSDPDSAAITASASVCALLASRFDEHLQLTMSAVGADRVVGLSLSHPKVPTTCPTTGLPRLALDEVLLNTTATLHFPAEGPRPLGKIHDAAFLPPAAAAAQRASLGPDGKPMGQGAEGEQPQQNQSFLRKYWM